MKLFKPTPEHRKAVRAMAGYGITQPDIARVIGLGEAALRKHFRAELDLAEIEANAQVAQTLFKMAIGGGNVAATIFWLKTRAKWRETTHHEHSGNINLGNTPIEDIESELAAIRARTATAVGTRAVEADVPGRPGGLLN